MGIIATVVVASIVAAGGVCFCETWFIDLWLVCRHIYMLAGMPALLKLKQEPKEDYHTYANCCEEAGVLEFTLDDLESEV